MFSPSDGVSVFVGGNAEKEPRVIPDMRFSHDWGSQPGISRAGNPFRNHRKLTGFCSRPPLWRPDLSMAALRQDRAAYPFTTARD